jgi:hypothetical protein
VNGPLARLQRESVRDKLKLVYPSTTTDPSGRPAGADSALIRTVLGPGESKTGLEWLKTALEWLIPPLEWPAPPSEWPAPAEEWIIHSLEWIASRPGMSHPFQGMSRPFQGGCESRRLGAASSGPKHPHADYRESMPPHATHAARPIDSSGPIRHTRR